MPNTGIDNVVIAGPASKPRLNDAVYVLTPLSLSRCEIARAARIRDAVPMKA